jgi:myo-inositol 2-dehydrogenase / D-chiro-inositol 1-dehydrogenase
MSEITRYGILGCGMMGQEHIRNLNLLDGASVAAICEPDQKMRNKAHLLAPEAHLADDLPDLLNSKIDALVISTPNYLHCEQLLEVLDSCRIPVMVEKPLVTSMDDLRRLNDYCNLNNPLVWVGMEYRYMPAIQEFIGELRADTMGSVHMLSIREHRFPFLHKVGHWNRFNQNTGGTFVEKCCHFFDLMRLFLQSEPVRIYASAGQDHNHLKEEYADGKPDILDNGFVIVEFAEGQRAMLDLCMFAEGSQYEQEISAIGSRAKIECKLPGPKLLWGDLQVEPELIISPRNPVGVDKKSIAVDMRLENAGSHHGATYHEHAAFQKTLREGAPIEVTVSDGLIAVLMGLAAQRSAQTGASIGVDVSSMSLSYE